MWIHITSNVPTLCRPCERNKSRANDRKKFSLKKHSLRDYRGRRKREGDTLETPTTWQLFEERRYALDQTCLRLEPVFYSFVSSRRSLQFLFIQYWWELSYCLHLLRIRAYSCFLLCAQKMILITGVDSNFWPSASIQPLAFAHTLHEERQCVIS